MSRIAKIPVQIVQGVSYTLTADNITVKGRVKSPCTFFPS